MKTTYRNAVHDAIREAMRNDPRVVLLGEDVGRYGGTYAASKGLLEEFGPERIRDTPLSELGFVGIGIGAAINGLRPIVEVMTVNFSLLALDQIVNTAAALRHMSGGQFSVPLVVRMATGAGRQLAAQHSHSLEGWYAHIPGIKVVAPATVADAYGMLLTALDDPDPVIVFEHVQLYNTAVDVDSLVPTDISRAALRRNGTDVTLIAYGGCVPKALDAADQLALAGIDCEVIDLRVLRPLDDDTILESVRKTHRAVVIDEAWRTGSLAGEISARIVEGAFYDLDAPIARVCSVEVPIPYAKHLEEAALPQPDKIVAAVRGLFGDPGGQERSDPGKGTGGQERSDPGKGTCG
ncbi:alpha-ketoacid dehydrogenase subunit beta [Mycolicibacterium aichiense]|uniref:3-methyl-2-oxobutanoate dehydrogenase subunit beta n=1 Tax=Mycolicibacterium aichiense TaxID=1799 RepID=A0AAD1HRC7_9MYCO|nr:alpha-ketoacid dehydrogenase subunit beta [Mycolicibacterium aichiense]MCV7017257.1 alpha-ketoacid dehydrogenase subunit beta [Mycolicibacterium aichiense]BBX10312.1 pyruvate dehydrogenase subunit beta [Mycolicibacterium aichiense]STZ26028.1 pyruvate dehydrogenase E1 component [Mycolicibacterium aichiense]